MKVDVIVPEDYMGDVIGDLNCPPRPDSGYGAARRCADISRDAFRCAEMFGYATDLRSQHAGSWPVYHAAQPLQPRCRKCIARRRSSATRNKEQ